MNYLEMVLETEQFGGSTRHNVSGEKPSDGYMVGIGQERLIAADEFCPACLEDYANRRELLLRQADLFLGTWTHDGIIYMDISRNILDVDDALTAAVNTGEDAVWDIVNEEAVWV